MSQTHSNKITFEQSEDISLPVNTPPGRLVPGRDWDSLKRIVARLGNDKNYWQRAFDLAGAAALAFFVAWLTPNSFKIANKVSVQLLFGFAFIGSLAFCVAAWAAKSSSDNQNEATKTDLETWVSDVEALYRDDQEIAPSKPTPTQSAGNNVWESGEELYIQAVALAREKGVISTSLIQRRLRIGYGRAARIVERMEQEGIVGEPDGARPRRVLSDSDK